VSDGNGLLTVKDGSGAEVVRLDNTGITILAGTMSNIVSSTISVIGGTISNAFIGTPSITGGTIRNAFIGTSQMTGGTVTSPTINYPTVNEGIYTGGTINTAIGTIANLLRIGTSSNYVQIDGTNGIRFYGSATMWDDQMIDIGRVRTGPTGTAPLWGTLNGCEVLSFADGTVNSISFTTQMPHRGKVGGSVDYHIHYSPAGTHTGSAVWQFTHSWTTINGTFPATGTIMATVPITANTNNYHFLYDIGNVGTNPGISSMLLCTLARIGTATADTYGSAIYLLQSDFHYEIDSVGSDEETSKS
jgi:hypothetical protein